MPDERKQAGEPERIAPLLTKARGENEGHSELVIDCPQHALPFGVIFEEYAARRTGDLKKYGSEVLQVNEDQVLSTLKALLETRDDLYRQLKKAKDDGLSSSQIDGLEKMCGERDRPLKRVLHKMKGSAVCLSGGGIRSASFSLGVLEGLARFSLGVLTPAKPAGQKMVPGAEANSASQEKPEGLLHKLDYLSTVSGGGYIGSWLSAWLYRKQAAQAAPAPGEKQEVKAPPSSWKSSYAEVVEALAGESTLPSGDPSPRPVRHLREYTAYLAPALGLSLDSWDLAAIVSRNMLINWVTLIPLLLAAMAAPQVSYYISRDLPYYLQGSIAWGGLLLVLLLFILAAVFAGISLPSHRNANEAGPTPSRVVLGFAAPVLLANWLVVELWRGLPRQVIPQRAWQAAAAIALLGFLVMAGMLFRSNRQRVLASGEAQKVKGWRGVIRGVQMLAAALAAAAATFALLRVLAKLFPYLLQVHQWKYRLVIDDRLFAILALPLFTLVPLLAVSLFAGLVGVFEQEEDREWFSRAGAIQLAFIVVWIGIHAVSLYATDILLAIKLGVAGAILGGVGSGIGWSGATSAGPRPMKMAQLSKVGSFLKKHDLLLPGLCAIALILIALGGAGIEHFVARKLNVAVHAYFLPGFCGQSGCTGFDLGRLWSNCYLATHTLILVGFFILTLLVNWAININLFSLHGMYRMRLMRAFLGASNTERRPDRFTQFDAEDTPKTIQLPRAPGAPLHVINTTLNLVGTRNLAWRQRKAESFTFSSLHSGCWRLAYVPTDVYGGTDGVSLATAMAISGAAFNPNMGYHSSPLVTLLMTFFNVRLGWWLPNPAREEGAHHAVWSAKGADFLHKTGPTMALEPLILEAFGLTDDDYRWIELTDGGHFENLGLYEMVLRRCHNIIVVDAGADPDCQFEDLGNALRKIEIDLGIPIRFNDGIKMKAGARKGNHYCAVATIDYACADDYKELPQDEKDKLAGKLIYIKAAITGQEPPDIKQYALTHSMFPHESTANQFFNEAQFESYRHLGSFEIEAIAGQAPAPMPFPDLQDLHLMASSAPLRPGTDFKSFTQAATAYAKQ